MAYEKSQKLTVVLFAAAWLAAFPFLSLSPEVTSDEAEEYAVRNVVISERYLFINPEAQRVLIRDETSLYPVKTDHLRKALADSKNKGLASFRERLAASTLNDFEKKNTERRPLRQQFHLEIPYEVVSEKQVHNLRVKDAKGCSCVSTEDRPWLGLITLSSVGFNDAKDQALVYAVLEDCRGVAAGTYVLLGKRNGEWHFLNELNLGYQVKCR